MALGAGVGGVVEVHARDARFGTVAIGSKTSVDRTVSASIGVVGLGAPETSEGAVIASESLCVVDELLWTCRPACLVGCEHELLRKARETARLLAVRTGVAA